MVFSGYSGFLHQKTDRHDKTEILLNVALNTITLTPGINFMQLSPSANLQFLVGCIGNDYTKDIGSF